MLKLLKKTPIFILSLSLLVAVLIPIKNARAMDPRFKVLLTTAAYGTVGGALLGTASLAFGGRSRTIFQGASIGLYAGLIFGSYIIYSHHASRSSGNTDGQYYEDPDSPYGGGPDSDDSSYDRFNQNDNYGGGQYDRNENNSTQYGRTNFWNPYGALEEHQWEYGFASQRGHFQQPKTEVPLTINFLNYSF